MNNVSSFEMHRTGWTLNEVVKDGKVNKLVALYLCYVAQYGRTPVYAIHNLKTGTVGRFNGTAEELFKLFSNKVPVKVSLHSRTVGFSDILPPEERDNKINEQVTEDFSGTGKPDPAKVIKLKDHNPKMVSTSAI